MNPRNPFLRKAAPAPMLPSAEEKPTNKPSPEKDESVSRPTAEYVPRDISLYATAACLFAAAFQPPGHHPNDQKQANEAGEKLAQLLDSGIVPKGCTIDEIHTIRRKADGQRYRGEGADEPVPMLDLVNQRDALTASRNGQQRNGPMMTAAHQKDYEDRLGWAAGGADSIPSKEDVLARSAAAAERFPQISEAVRTVVLFNTYTRISKDPGITGAPQCIQSAIDVMVFETRRVSAFFEKIGMPVFAPTNQEEGEAQGLLAYPYPSTLPMEAIGMAMSALPDMSDIEARVSRVMNRIEERLAALEPTVKQDNASS